MWYLKQKRPATNLPVMYMLYCIYEEMFRAENIDNTGNMHIMYYYVIN